MAAHSSFAVAISLFLLGMAGAGEAATMIKFKDAEQEGPSQVWLVGGKARMEQLGESDGYMIVDFKNKKQFLVSDQEKQVIEIGGLGQHGQGLPGMPPPAEAKPLDIKLEKKGKGPEVAGYATDHYVVSVDGQKCFEEYLAKEPLGIPDVKAFAEAMGELSTAAGPGASTMKVCDRAELELSRKYPSVGLPMRSFDSSGQLISEIEVLKTGIEPPKGAFDLPTDYQRVTMEDMLRKMMESMPPGAGMPPQ